MSEQANAPIDSLYASAPVDKQTEAGTLLRTARQAQGLPIEMLAVSLKVPVNKLEALEADRYEAFPDTVFLRALASGVCRALKIDPTPVLEALPRSHAPKIKTDDDSLNTSFNDGSSSSANLLLNYLRRPIGIALVVLISGISAIVFFPKNTSFESSSLTSVIGGTSALKESATQVDASLQVPASSAALPAATSFSVSETLVTPVISDGTQSQKAVSQLVLEPKDSLPNASDRQVSGAPLLAFHAHGTSWVEVVDAKGALLLRKTLVSGEVVPVSGTVPLTVVIGRSDLISTLVRGQPLDTTTMSNNNVARFEVK